MTPGPVPQSPALRRLRRLLQRSTGRPRASAWEHFSQRSLPLIEPIPGDRDHCRLTFVWRPERPSRAPSVNTSLVDSLAGEAELLPLDDTGVWYRSVRLPRATRGSYQFSARPAPGMEASDGAWARYVRAAVPDPGNPHRLVFPKNPDDPSDREMVLSVVALPGAPRRPWARAPARPSWTEEVHHLWSRRMGNRRSIWVELPPGFQKGQRLCGLVIAFDGVVYRSTVPAPRIVQWLVREGRIPPTALVLVGNPPRSRVREMGLDPSFPEFLARELLPWLRRTYRTDVRPSRTVLAGSSLGGLAAAFSALRHPESFGAVLAQSGAFQWSRPSDGGGPGALMRAYARLPRLPIRFYLEAGRRESLAAPGAGLSLLAASRHFRDVLVAKGYPVAYSEFEGGHDYACWPDGLRSGLSYLLGRGARAPGAGRS